MSNKSNRSSSIVTDTARATIIANAEASLNKTMAEWGADTAATFKREGIASFTMVDAKVWSAARRAEGVADGNIRYRLMTFRNALENAGITVVRSKQGGAKNGKAGGTAKAAKAAKAGSKASTDKGEQREPRHALEPTPQVALDLLAGKITGRRQKGITEKDRLNAYNNLVAVAAFLGLDIATA